MAPETTSPSPACFSRAGGPRGGEAAYCLRTSESGRERPRPSHRRKRSRTILDLPPVRTAAGRRHDGRVASHSSRSAFMRLRRRWSLALVVVCWLGLAGVAQATTSRSPEPMTRRAPAAARDNCSLRQAVNRSVSGDTIELNAPSPAVYRLTQGTRAARGARADDRWRWSRGDEDRRHVQPRLAGQAGPDPQGHGRAAADPRADLHRRHRRPRRELHRAAARATRSPPTAAGRCSTTARASPSSRSPSTPTPVARSAARSATPARWT